MKKKEKNHAIKTPNEIIIPSSDIVATLEKVKLRSPPAVVSVVKRVGEKFFSSEVLIDFLIFFPLLFIETIFFPPLSSMLCLFHCVLYLESQIHLRNTLHLVSYAQT